MSDGADNGPITFETALEVIKDLGEEHLARTGPPISSVVVVGGTAMAAMALRARSEDVDLYVDDIDDAAIDATTQKFKRRFGLKFKIDATPSKQLWGTIVVDDVDTSPTVRTIACGPHKLAVKALSAETMYLVKVSANREKDQPDIAALAKATTYEATLKRARQLFPWYANRNSFPNEVERLARHMSRDFGKRLTQVDKDFGRAEHIFKKVQEIRAGQSLQFMRVLKEHMRKRLDLLTFDPRNPKRFVSTRSGRRRRRNPYDHSQGSQNSCRYFTCVENNSSVLIGWRRDLPNGTHVAGDIVTFVGRGAPTNLAIRERSSLER